MKDSRKEELIMVAPIIEPQGKSEPQSTSCKHKYKLISSKPYRRVNDATLRMENYTEYTFYCEKCLDCKTIIK